MILRDTPLNPLQGDYFSVKQEVVSPDNMCVGRISRGEAQGRGGRAGSGVCGLVCGEVYVKKGYKWLYTQVYTHAQVLVLDII